MSCRGRAWEGAFVNAEICHLSPVGVGRAPPILSLRQGTRTPHSGGQCTKKHTGMFDLGRYVHWPVHSPSIDRFTMSLQQFFSSRVEELVLAQQLVLQAVRDKTVPSLDSVAPEVVRTAAATLVLATFVVFILISSRWRRLLLDTVETIIASILLLLLVGIVVTLPFGTGDEHAGHDEKADWIFIYETCVAQDASPSRPPSAQESSTSPTGPFCLWSLARCNYRGYELSSSKRLDFNFT